MPSKVTTTADLLAHFMAKATAPPPESSQILVRHLQCKESIRAAQSLTEALDRYGASSWNHVNRDGEVPTRTMKPRFNNTSIMAARVAGVPSPVTASHHT
jgi:hypothetical protein